MRDLSDRNVRITKNTFAVRITKNTFAIPQLLFCGRADAGSAAVALSLQADLNVVEVVDMMWMTCIFGACPCRLVANVHSSRDINTSRFAAS
jgi:hypothetical protein